MLLFSAPGTGTNFAMYFMTEYGWKNGGIAWGHTQVHDFVVQLHSHENQLLDFEERICPVAEAFPKVIIPLRHPYKAYRSYNRSGATHEAILEYWQCLVKRVGTFKEEFFISVDIAEEKRLPLIQRLGKFCGIEDQEHIESYAERWKPVNKGPDDQPPVAEHIPDFDFAVEWFDAMSRQWK